MVNIWLSIHLILLLCFKSCICEKWDADTICCKIYHLNKQLGVLPAYNQCLSDIKELQAAVDNNIEYLMLTKTCSDVKFDWIYAKNVISLFYNKKWPAGMIKHIILNKFERKHNNVIAEINVDFWNKFYFKDNWKLKNLFAYSVEISESEQYRNALQSYLALDNDKNKDFIEKCTVDIVLGISAGLHDRNFHQEELEILYRSACLAIQKDTRVRYEWTYKILKDLFTDKKIHDASLYKISFILKYGLPLADAMHLYKKMKHDYWQSDSIPAFKNAPDNGQLSNEELDKFQDAQSVFSKIITSGINLSCYKKMQKIAESAAIPIDLMHDFIIDSNNYNLAQLIYMDTFRFLIDMYKRKPEQYKEMKDFTKVLWKEGNYETQPAAVLKMAKEHNMDMKQTYTFMNTVCYTLTEYMMVQCYEKLSKFGLDNIFEIMAEKNLENVYDYIHVFEDEDLTSNKDLIKYFFQCDIAIDCPAITVKLIIQFNDKQSEKMDKEKVCSLYKLVCSKKMNLHYREMKDIFDNQTTNYLSAVDKINVLSSTVGFDDKEVPAD